MRTLLLLLCLLTTACATVQPRPEPDLGMEGSGSPGPRGVSLLSMLEGQAMAPVGSPSWRGQAYSLTTTSDITAGGSVTGNSLVSSAGSVFGTTFNASGFGAGMVVVGAVPDSAAAIAFSLNNAVTLSTTGAVLSEWKNNGTRKANIDKDGAFQSTSTKMVGTITLSAGSGTATVNSGAKCVCSDTTSAAACKTSVSSTTLTVTGTGTDVVAYICI